MLVNPGNPNAKNQLRDLQVPARTLGLQLHEVHASTDLDFDSVFTNLIQMRTDALVIGTDGFFLSRARRLGALALHHRVPAVFQYPEFASAGGLMSYGGSDAEMYRLVGVYTGKILNGEKPADLPVQQSAKVELIINMKAAKAFSLTVPPALLGRADEVIE